MNKLLKQGNYIRVYNEQGVLLCSYNIAKGRIVPKKGNPFHGLIHTTAIAKKLEQISRKTKP